MTNLPEGFKDEAPSYPDADLEDPRMDEWEAKYDEAKHEAADPVNQVVSMAEQCGFVRQPDMPDGTIVFNWGE